MIRPTHSGHGAGGGWQACAGADLRYSAARARLQRYLAKMSSTRTAGPSGHERAVAALREQYAALPPGAPVRLGKRTSNLFRFRPPAAGPRLDVSHFDHVLDVDPGTRTADVQGMVTYEKLVAATLPHGLMPLVVPQLKTITLGGAVVGLGIESSSFRNGLPHESVREMEILTGDGRVVVARPTGAHADLFAALPNSYGTLGYALRLRIDLEPVAPFVRLRHLRFTDAKECAATMADVCTAGRTAASRSTSSTARSSGAMRST